MARLRRDVFAWCTALPGATLMLTCLFLPQLRECNGRVRTPFDTGCAPLMAVIASLGVVPALWPWLRIAPRRVLADLSAEELVATAAVLATVAFVAVFPLLSMFGTWLIGGELAWTAGWLELAGVLAWSSAAGDRTCPDVGAALAPPLRDRYSSTATNPARGVLIQGVAPATHDRIVSS